MFADEFLSDKLLRIRMIDKIDVNTKFVPTEQWKKFFDKFSTINYKRHISIEVVDSEGDRELVENAPLSAMIYGRSNNGDNLAIEVDNDETTYGYSIDTPLKFLQPKTQTVKPWRFGLMMV